MARVKEVHVEATYLKSLPNYENIRVGAAATLVIEEGDSVPEVYKKAWDMVGREVAGQIAEFGGKKK
ncbi:hypothetical protein [Paenibacillus xylanexedens]|uniref:hypothetical protein n=1 Tax=Paenibacillus xylanexedens TaxID=528191 RepID=UPI0011A3221C|nr:hypothetical protein [Paenibacillus xylanexedens]